MWVVQCSLDSCQREIVLTKAPQRGMNIYCTKNCRNRFRKKRGLAAKRDCSSKWYRHMLDGAFCHYCFRIATTRDHIIAFNRGGPTKLWNLVPACKECNSAKKKSELPTCTCAKCQSALVWYSLGYASI